jgi:hypothetical protein
MPRIGSWVRHGRQLGLPGNLSFMDEALGHWKAAGIPIEAGE